MQEPRRRQRLELPGGTEDALYFKILDKTPFPLKWEILLILGILAVFEKYIF
jgi:hypothetical protein